MIAYFETSAFVKLLLEEEESGLAHELWNQASAAVCVSVGYVEASAAVARAVRVKRLARGELTRTVDALKYLWGSCDVVEVDGKLIERAAQLTHRYPLAGYDSIHLATAEQVGGAAQMVTWDRQLAEAAFDLRIPTIGAV